ncbi:Cytochrome c5 family protein [Rubrivivax sp. A210]|uniref:c-type cytochrome n=1 Tax=Rubrivivax sp. A210 TaxID=2772301 RepID=UPI00191913FF|nr:c-type cytochrome [Rubrivivax sp. A210]CAD5372317.1 Cytochrome c5 family protein [Rubrivivax sp. A210]
MPFSTFFPLPRQFLCAVLSFGTVGAALADGKSTYEKTCAACHASGIANAPRYGDKTAWQARSGAGVPALVASVVKGKGAMPPKGGNPALKQGDIQGAVEFMLAAAH